MSKPSKPRSSATHLSEGVLISKSKLDPKSPAHYPRRALVVLADLSPQVVTETLYALTQKESPPFMPQEMFVLTTGVGARIVRDALLDPDKGQFNALRHEYALPHITFTERNVLTVRGEDGQPLDDAHDEDAFLRMGDMLMRTLAQLAADPEMAIHLSIAGGRKSMGYLAGHALSLLGRPQDRLSHVLVESIYESRDFFYPTKKSKTVTVTPSGGKSTRIDFSKANVRLAHVPILFLREWLPQSLINRAQSISFTDMIRSAQKSLEDPVVEVNTYLLEMRFGGDLVHLAPDQFAFYLLLTERREEGIARSASDEESRAFLDCLTRVLPGATELQRKAMVHEQVTYLEDGWFVKDRSGHAVEMGQLPKTTIAKLIKSRAKKMEESASRINSALEKSLGPSRAVRYQILAAGGYGQRHYVLQESLKVKVVDNRPRKDE